MQDQTAHGAESNVRVINSFFTMSVTLNVLRSELYNQGDKQA